jgi:hypothetical protein
MFCMCFFVLTVCHIIATLPQALDLKPFHEDKQLHSVKEL